MISLFDLVVFVANKLAERSVIISPDPPPYRGQPGRRVTGAAYKNKNGVPVIHIPPGSDEYSFSVLLHELAHVRLHADVFPVLDNPRPQAEQMPVNRHKGDMRREFEADKLADKWLEIAKKHAGEFTGSQYQSLLEAIYKYGG